MKRDARGRPADASQWNAMHEDFCARLRECYGLQGLVAARLLETGLWVKLPLLHVAETFGGPSDEGDVLVLRNERTLKIEVKSTRFAFSEGGQDFRFGRPIVTTCADWDRKRPKPVAFVLVSQVTLAMAALSCRTSATWIVQSKSDSTRGGYTQDYWTCRRDQLQPFDALVKALKS